MENSGLKKVRIFWDCLFPACQGLKIGINRQLLSDLLYKVKPVLSSVHPRILIRHTPWNPEARQRHQKQSHTLHQTQCSQASADHLYLWNNDTDILRRPRSDHSHPVEAERCILYRRRRRCHEQDVGLFRDNLTIGTCKGVEAGLQVPTMHPHPGLRLMVPISLRKRYRPGNSSRRSAARSFTVSICLAV